MNARMVENVALYRRLGFAVIGRLQGEGGDRVSVATAKPASERRGAVRP